MCPSRKESATAGTATADEYKKKKKQVEVRQEDIERARRITKSLNEHEIKATTRTHTTEVRSI